MFELIIIIIGHIKTIDKAYYIYGQNMSVILHRTGKSIIMLENLCEVLACSSITSLVTRAGKNLRFLKKVFSFLGFNVYAQSYTEH